MRAMPGPLRALRLTALIEAVSYVLLLGVAMPLKYVWGMRLMVSVVGMVHGLLFLLLIWLLLRAHFEYRWPARRLWLLVAAAFVPLWPFFLDHRLRGWIAATPEPNAAKLPPASSR
jgi:integral membrane protein